MRKKLLVIGHCRHGKDTVADMLKQAFGYTFQSSSVAAAKIFLFEALKEKYGYRSFLDCFEDRVNRRKEWHDLICEYNTPDKARLAKAIMRENDIYVGMRSNEELEACLKENVFDLVIGVYDPRKPLEPADSFDIDLWAKADVVIPNGGSLGALNKKILQLKPLL